MLGRLLPVAALLLATFTEAKSFSDVKKLHEGVVERFNNRGKRTPTVDARASNAKTGPTSAGWPGNAVQNITFTNPEASQFFVNGTLPLVPFNFGPSWSGLLPISNHPNETRKLFFWFFPPGPEGDLDKLTFWTNGGPGCSSLEGLLQENGPFSWSYGQATPTVNQWSWTNLSSLLYVEQPVGTGFSQGTPNITNEVELAEQFVGFLNVFLDVFTELKGKKFWVSGESYAGMYVPYIADYIYSNHGVVDLDLQGIWISDPVIGWDVVQEQIPAVDFVHKYDHVFSFDNATMATLDAKALECNYTGYYEKYATYPPAGPLPLPGDSTENARGCDLWDEIFDAASTVNPAFNIYRIFDTWPILWDVLGFPGSFEFAESPIYFNRPEVKKAIHAPLDVQWAECSNVDVFVQNDDTSLPSSFTALPRVLEASNRSVIVHGLGDFILIAEGTRIAIQNMTWNGLQGFQTPIADDSFSVDGYGVVGTSHTERSLTFFEVVLSGHMIPQFSPWSAYRIMEYLLGVKDTPSD